MLTVWWVWPHHYKEYYSFPTAMSHEHHLEQRWQADATSHQQGSIEEILSCCICGTHPIGGRCHKNGAVVETVTWVTNTTTFAAKDCLSWCSDHIELAKAVDVDWVQVTLQTAQYSVQLASLPNIVFSWHHCLMPLARCLGLAWGMQLQGQFIVGSVISSSHHEGCLQEWHWAAGATGGGDPHFSEE